MNKCMLQMFGNIYVRYNEDKRREFLKDGCYFKEECNM